VSMVKAKTDGELDAVVPRCDNDLQTHTQTLLSQGRTLLQVCRYGH
jgi:hypothetical protein